MLAALPDADELVKMHGGDRPEWAGPADKSVKFATAADVRRIMASIRWLWDVMDSGFADRRTRRALKESAKPGRTRPLQPSLEWDALARWTGHDAVLRKRPRCGCVPTAITTRSWKCSRMFAMPDEAVFFPVLVRRPIQQHQLR